MLGRLVELEAHPFAHAGLAEQRDGAVDQVVEIDCAQAPLGPRIGLGIDSARFKPRGEQVRIGGLALHPEQFGAGGMEPHRMVGIGRILRRLPLAERARLALGSGPDRMEIGKAGGACLRGLGQPGRGDVRPLQAAGRAPVSVHHRQRAQASEIEGVVSAPPGDLGIDIARGQPQRLAQPRLDQQGQFGKRLPLAGTGLEEILGLALAQAQRQRADCIHHPTPMFALGIDEHLGERLARQHRFLALIERAKAGDQPRLHREGGEQRLAEAVDRLDADAAPGRVEHLGEELAGPFAAGGRNVLAQRLEIGGQFGIGRADPAGEPAGDPLGHLGGAGLGEGEAQDRARIGAVQQQPPDARSEHLRLAGASRGGEPDMAPGVARRLLIALEPVEGADFRHFRYPRSVRYP